MFAVVLAAMAGVFYGASDFSGAAASRGNHPTVVTLGVQITSVVALIGALFVLDGVFHPADLVWGALGGLSLAAGLALFYEALTVGPIATAASLTALVSASLPILAGLALGDRPAPLTLLGVALAVPAAVLVSAGEVGVQMKRTNTTPRERVVGQRQLNRTRMLSVGAGTLFAGFLVALSQVGEDAGLFPLLGTRAAAISFLVLLITLQRVWTPVRRQSVPLVMAGGLFDCGADGFLLTAYVTGDLSWVAAISSLAPVSTVLLARVFFKERLTIVQIIGLALSAAALALVAVGRNM
ncbi:MAG: DMT family transporter [Acidimicrobiales bacterium]|nr:DMT family transporter [Acidimicrobiales bacterium]